MDTELLKGIQRTYRSTNVKKNQQIHYVILRKRNQLKADFSTLL